MIRKAQRQMWAAAELANFQSGQLRLSSLWSRKEKNEEIWTPPQIKDWGDTGVPGGRREKGRKDKDSQNLSNFLNTSPQMCINLHIQEAQ